MIQAILGQVSTERMPLLNLSLTKLGPESDQLLCNLLEHYIHDMAEWFDIDTRPDGSYGYNTSTIWAENGYDAYLAKVGDSIAGFALIGSAREWLGDIGAHDVHEFFVIRRHRRNGVGQAMAMLLWNRYPGQWLVRVLEANAPAILFWRTAIATHSNGRHQEEMRLVNGRPWRFFTFGAPASADLTRQIPGGST